MNNELERLDKEISDLNKKICALGQERAKLKNKLLGAFYDFIRQYIPSSNMKLIRTEDKKEYDKFVIILDDLSHSLLMNTFDTDIVEGYCKELDVSLTVCRDKCIMWDYTKKFFKDVISTDEIEK